MVEVIAGLYELVHSLTPCLLFLGKINDGSSFETDLRILDSYDQRSTPGRIYSRRESHFQTVLTAEVLAGHLAGSTKQEADSFVATSPTLTIPLTTCASK